MCLLGGVSPLCNDKTESTHPEVVDVVSAPCLHAVKLGNARLLTKQENENDTLNLRAFEAPRPWNLGAFEALRCSRDRLEAVTHSNCKSHLVTPKKA